MGQAGIFPYQQLLFCNYQLKKEVQGKLFAFFLIIVHAFWT